MSKKHHRNEVSDRQGGSQTDTKPQAPSNVTLGDLTDEAEPRKQIGPPVAVVERQPLARAFTEFLLIFGIFFLYGAWPVPHVNEPHYVGKAAHVWHPETFQNDVFLNSHDTHWLFYKSFGWLTLHTDWDTATWIGRVFLWLALAFGWYRLSRAVIGMPWASVISAAVFACFMVKFPMAGEWVIGGVEGKVFAYVLVFLGLDALARNRWWLVWVMFGLAAAYHPVVGGWSVVAGAIAWLLQRRSDRMPLKRMIVPLLIGGAISLIGVMPAVMMDRPPKTEVAQNEQQDKASETGETQTQQPVPPPQNAFAVPDVNANTSADATDDATKPSTAESQPTDAKSEHEKTKERSYYIAVFKRLSHHQLPYAFRTSWVIRLSLLTVAWLFCAAIVWGRKTVRPDDPQALPDDEPIVQPPAPPGFRIACFIVGTIVISCTGFIIAYGLRVPNFDENELPAKVVLAAKLLRFYWFRMTDFAIPMGMGLCGATIFYQILTRCHREKYPVEPYWWVKTLGGTAFVIGIVYGLAFLYFTNFCPPVQKGISYELRLLESQTLAYGVVLVAMSFLLFWWRNDKPQPDRLPTRPAVMLLLSLLLVFGASIPMLLDMTEKRLAPTVPRTALWYSPDNYQAWREMCDWISENTPEDAVFLVPRRDESFKWHAKRANVSTWKEMPQDAVSMVKWDETMTDCYTPSMSEEELQEISPRTASYLSFIIKTKSRDELIRLQEKYGFSYILCEERPELNLPVAHRTQFYVLYQADAETLNPQNFQSPGLINQPAPTPVPGTTMPVTPVPVTGSPHTSQMPTPNFISPASEPVSQQPVSNSPVSNGTVPFFRPSN